VYRHADAIIVNSKWLAEDIVTFARVPKRKIHVVYNPKFIANITEKAKGDVQHSWFLQKELPVVIAMGRLTRQKDFPTLIRAFSDVQKHIPARLMILGNGGDHKALRALIEDLGLKSKVEIIGFTNNPYAYLARADLFVSSSLWEGMPNALLEAMIVGLPIVATDCNSGPREILAPETDFHRRIHKDVEYGTYGVLVPIGDAPRLSSAILKLLKDGKLKNQYTQKAFQRAQDFDIKNMLSKYKDVIDGEDL